MWQTVTLKENQWNSEEKLVRYNINKLAFFFFPYAIVLIHHSNPSQPAIFIWKIKLLTCIRYEISMHTETPNAWCIKYYLLFSWWPSWGNTPRSCHGVLRRSQPTRCPEGDIEEPWHSLFLTMPLAILNSSL